MLRKDFGMVHYAFILSRVLCLYLHVYHENQSKIHREVFRNEIRTLNKLPRCDPVSIPCFTPSLSRPLRALQWISNLNRNSETNLRRDRPNGCIAFEKQVICLIYCHLCFNGPKDMDDRFGWQAMESDLICQMGFLGLSKGQRNKYISVPTEASMISQVLMARHSLAWRRRVF